MNGADGSKYWHMLEVIRRAEPQQRKLHELVSPGHFLDDHVRHAIEQQCQSDDAIGRKPFLDDSFRRAVEQQRQIDEATRHWRLFDELGIARRQADIMALPSVNSALDALTLASHLSAAEELISHQQRLDEWERLLRQSIRPYPDITSISHAAASEVLWGPYGRLNVSLNQAGLLAEVELDDQNDYEKVEGSEVESQLIEIVPAEALDALKRVEFVPFSLLSAAVRDPRMLFHVPPRTFEQFVAELMSRLGITDVLLTPERADGGRDVIGTVKVAGISLIVAFECKRYAPDNPVPIETARALLGTINHGEYRADRGVLVTTSRFTAPAQRFILTAPQLEGRDFDGIVNWLRDFTVRQHDIHE